MKVSVRKFCLLRMWCRMMFDWAQTASLIQFLDPAMIENVQAHGAGHSF